MQKSAVLCDIVTGAIRYEWHHVNQDTCIITALHESVMIYVEIDSWGKELRRSSCYWKGPTSDDQRRFQSKSGFVGLQL